MRRLLVFTENYSRGGGNRYLIDAVNSVVEEFDEVVIASNGGGIYAEDIDRLKPPARIFSFHFITKARVDNALIGMPSIVRRALTIPLFFAEPLLFMYNVFAFMLKIGRLVPSSVLCCNGGYPGGRASLALVVAAALKGVPVAMSVVSTPMRRKPVFGIYESLIDRIVWNCANVVIVNARAIANRLVELRGMPPSKYAIAHNGLGDSWSGKSAVKSAASLTIGCIMRTDRAKGVFFLVEAFLSLAKRHSQIALKIVGRGDAHEELVSFVNASGLKGRIELAGFFTGDINELLGSIDIYAFPSLQEGLPYSILEAMAAARPIVATRVGGIPEAITDGAEGLLVAPSSSRELEIALERLIEDPALRLRLASGARDRFLRDFTIDAMRKSVKEAFAEAGML